MSNHIAMLTALGTVFPEAREQGLNRLSKTPKIVMAGSIAHYSHSDAAFHLGIGWNNIIKVKTNSNFTTSASDLEKVLKKMIDSEKVFMVVGVAGNCRTTGVDDLDSLAKICKRYNVWFHVDACHGGNLLFSKTLRGSLLKGIEKADSVSVDPHKGLFTSYPSSYVLFKKSRLRN